jgi:hypothetical protein
MAVCGGLRSLGIGFVTGLLTNSHFIIGLGIEEEASEVLRLEHSFIWC